ncbi:MAG: DNA polymerase domain-containing protein [Candidatus Hodarchaeota archaeon]
MVKIALSTIEYTKLEDQPIVHLFGRDIDSNRWHIRVYNLFPFFYIPKNIAVPKNPRIHKIENVDKQGWKSIDGTLVKKIYMKLPEDVGGNRKDKKGFRVRFKKTYEDDILFPTRAAIELGIKSGFEVNDTVINFKEDYFKPIDFKTELRRLHLDIETSGVETGGRLANWKNPINRIYSIANFDSYTNKFVIFVHHPKYKNNKEYETDFRIPFNPVKYGSQFDEVYPLTIHTFNNESDMLNEFIKYVNKKNPDIITGWNARGFDMPYLISRMQRLRLNVIDLSPLHSVYVEKKNSRNAWAHIKGRIVFDTWTGYKKTLTSEAESTKLDVVAKKIFNIGKVQHTGIDEMYESNRNLLIKYNVQDVFLEYAIGIHEGVFNFFYDVKCYSGCMFEDVLNNSRIVDTYMLFKAKERKMVLPSKRDRKKDESGGGEVQQAPRKGLARWLFVLDLKSLYPMIMLSLNMGEDTIVINPPKEQIPTLIKSSINNVYFRKDKISFLASILIELINYRAEIQSLVEKLYEKGKDTEAKINDRIQTVIKFITNSIFGVVGFNEFRLFNKAIFSNVTATGRIVIRFTIKAVRKLGYIVYYGDTDSIFVVHKATTLEGRIKEMLDIAKYLNEKYNIFLKLYNLDSHRFLMKGEKIYKTFFMVRKKGEERTAKKRYAGNIVWNDKKGITDYLDITGFDRSDMSRLGNRIMKDVLEMACYDRVEEIEPYLKKELKLLKNGHYPPIEIAYSTGIKKPLSTYGNQDWIRAARWTNRHSSLWGQQTEYGAGSKPKFIYLIRSKLPPAFQAGDYVRKKGLSTQIVALDDNFSLPPYLIEIIDYSEVIRKTIMLKVETILEALGLDWNSVVSNNKIKALSVY